jgi:hypothetical protein
VPPRTLHEWCYAMIGHSLAEDLMTVHPLTGYLVLAAKNRGAGFSFPHLVEHFFTAIGVISSFLAIIAFFTTFTWQPTVKRWIASLKLDEKIAGQEEKRDSLEDVVARLQSQIDNDVPREAERIYISDRMDSLTESLGEQYKEYSNLERRLSRLTSETGNLEAPIRQSIEKAVVPRYRLKERKERQLRFLVGLVLLLVVLPSYLSPNTLVYAYFNSIFEADYYPTSNLFVTIVLGGLVMSLPMWFLSQRWIIPNIKKNSQLVRFVSVTAVIAVLSLAGIAVYLDIQSSYYNSSYYYSNPSPTSGIGAASIVATLLLGLLLTIIWGGTRRVLRRVGPLLIRGLRS